MKAKEEADVWFAINFPACTGPVVRSDTQPQSELWRPHVEVLRNVLLAVLGSNRRNYGTSWILCDERGGTQFHSHGSFHLFLLDLNQRFGA